MPRRGAQQRSKEFQRQQDFNQHSYIIQAPWTMPPATADPTPALPAHNENAPNPVLGERTRLLDPVHETSPC